MFTTGFSTHASAGDAIYCTVDDFEITARLEYDDTGDKPDERDDGFWPSTNPDSAGYIGEGGNFAEQQAKAERVMQAWLDDEWFYVGVCLEVRKACVLLTREYSNALWGVECNYPDSDNAYLLEVANDLIPEALNEARAKLAELCKEG